MYNAATPVAMKGTPEGDRRSQRYNARLKLATIRHAMVGQLRRPPSGFRDVVPLHFRLRRAALAQQCAAWTDQEARDSVVQPESKEGAVAESGPRPAEDGGGGEEPAAGSYHDKMLRAGRALLKALAGLSE